MIIAMYKSKYRDQWKPILDFGIDYEGPPPIRIFADEKQLEHYQVSTGIEEVMVIPLRKPTIKYITVKKENGDIKED